MKLPTVVSLRSASRSATSPGSSSNRLDAQLRRERDTEQEENAASATRRRERRIDESRSRRSRITMRLRTRPGPASRPESQPRRMNLNPSCISAGRSRACRGNVDRRVAAGGTPSASVVTTRLTPDDVLVLNRFFASKNSSPRHRVAEWDEPRVSQVEVDHTAQAAGVALDVQRPIVVDAVLVQVQVRADVERQAAVGLKDDPELIVVEQHRTQSARRYLAAREQPDTDSVCVWLNGVTPLSRSRFVGSDTRSSPLPTT